MEKLLVFLLASSVPIVSPSAEGLSTGDRQRLIAHLEMTESWLVSELDGLSNDQLRFRMAPDTWSIMDVVEHLAIAEPQYWSASRRARRSTGTWTSINGFS